MSQRIKGQEVEIILLLNGAPQATITAIKSFQIENQLDISSEGYLGETTNRRDSVFNGVSGSMELHLDNKDIFDLFKAIIDKARRRTPGTRINLKATLQFPNGDRKRVLIPDAEFGALPLNFGSRTDFGTTTLTFQAASANFI